VAGVRNRGRAARVRDRCADRPDPARGESGRTDRRALRQVEGLELQLSAANAQLTNYHSQLGRIRTSVSAVVDQVANLNELVQANPFAPPAAPTAAAESPAAR